MEQIRYDVFISYRRIGGSEKAQLVKSEIRQRGVEEKRIFLDTHSLHDGDFEQKIKVAIEKSQSVVVIISNGCFEEVKDTDFWYMEIKEALQQGKKVVPIFFDGITSFVNLDVPHELLELTKKNAVTYQHEYAEAAFDKLIMFIGLQKEIHHQAKKRGCLFSLKYKGCLMSIAIVGFVVIVLAPITFMQFGSTKSPSSGEDDKVCYAPNYGNASECPSNLGVPPEGLGASEPVLEAGVSPDKKDEELSGIWRGLDDKLVLIFFRAGNVMMEKPDSGIVGEYGVDGNRIVFCWENGEKQTVRYEIGGNMLHLAFDDGQMVMLRKQ